VKILSGHKMEFPTESLSPRWLHPVMLLLAVGSGMAALIYEIVWFQLLELVVGSSAVSLAIILATFMGGTCLGSFIMPRLIPAQWNSLRVYAAIEFGIGALGILVLFLIPNAGGIYSSWSGYGLPGFLLRGIVAAACLLPPTLLMGATLPALVRRFEATRDGVSSWLGLFYGGNIAGSVIGCVLSGFYLLHKYDVTTATVIAAAINATVAFIALVLVSVKQESPVLAVEAQIDEGLRNSFNGRAVYVVIGLSGFCALAAESIWTRTLGLLLGASVYTLSIILVVFLAGLGIGSGMGSLLSRTIERPRLALGWCQMLLTGAIAWTSYSLDASLPYWPVNPSISSNIWFNFQLDLDRAFWALLPPTLLWGASFSFALASVASKRKDAARLFAGVYAANTLGAIVGALAASLLLIAWVGSQRAEQLLIALSAIAGLLLLPGLRRGSVFLRISTAVAAALVSALFIYSVPPISKLLIAYGRYAATWVGQDDIIYAEEGLNSSVAVSSFPNGTRTFHVAGKVQASNVPRDLRLQRMLGHLTSLTPANPRSILVIGCGAGITAGAISIDPRVERVTIVEIEPLVPQAASRFFSKPNFDVMASSKVHLSIDDGRHYLFTTKEKFDAITVDPLDPWVKGAANLYTSEFLKVARQHLNPGGVVTMYIQLFETDKEAVQSAIATFFEVFPNGTIWGNTYQGQGHDMVLMGQDEPLRINLDEMEKRFDSVADSFRDIGMNSAVDLLATYAGRKSDLTEWLKDAAINRDRNLRMQYLAGTGLNLDDSATIYSGMLAYRRFPADIFVGNDGKNESKDERLELLRESISNPSAIPAAGGR
jgi:spermidine synthase